MGRLYTCFFRFALLLTLPSLIICPPAQTHTASSYSQQRFNPDVEYLWDRIPRGDLISYDEVIDFIDQMLQKKF
jgi:hypothetical protein